MSAYLFPDAGVLHRFAASGRLDTLKSFVGGRGRWTAATAFEAGRISGAGAATLEPEGWMREPIEISAPEEIQRVQLLRRTVFGGIPDDPLSRLGEAETWHVLSKWRAFADSILVTDDPILLRYAQRCRIRARKAPASFSLREAT
ncbi:hypothetical protein NLM24_28900 [Nocardia zapadnayensis]|uniref:hypothetical protein n=1 Tax=Nocardia rhamnosiphila TaxID=426716 RepID=UPI00224659F8|nr:hypothetical protein [Nocardia zapadnayensis]MCX0274637.1 hypothetical protein [Nocardia zapadnayensis]